MPSDQLRGVEWLMLAENNKKSHAKLWIVLSLVAIQLFYVLSMGPAAWFVWQDWSPDWSFQAYRTFYLPVLFVARAGPRSVYNSLDWYVGLWHKFGIARFVWNG